eukprot:6025920-Pleurochrysis_carterae.AAC.3
MGLSVLLRLKHACACAFEACLRLRLKHARACTSASMRLPFARASSCARAPHESAHARCSACASARWCADAKNFACTHPSARVLTTRVREEFAWTRTHAAWYRCEDAGCSHMLLYSPRAARLARARAARLARARMGRVSRLEDGRGDGVEHRRIAIDEELLEARLRRTHQHARGRERVTAQHAIAMQAPPR